MSPTKYKLENLIKGVAIPDELKETVIYQTNANSAERKMEVTVISEELISYDVIEDYKKTVCEKFALNEFILRVKYENITIDDIDIDKYYKNLVFYVNEIIGGVRHLFLDSTAEYADGVLKIHCKYGTNMLNSMNCSETLVRLVKAQLKADIEVVFIDESDEGELEKLREATLNAIAIAPPPQQEVREVAPKAEDNENSDVIYGKDISGEAAVPFKDISEDLGQVVCEGEIITMDTRELKSEKTLLTFTLADNAGAYSCKAFLPKTRAKEILGNLKKGMYVKAKGKVQYDTFVKETVIMVSSIVKGKKKSRMDTANEKRVELHMHSKMSTMDGMTDVKDLIKTAISWGHKAIAVTDHGNVQAFPDAMHTAGDKIKVIYGVECYLVNDATNVVTGLTSASLDDEFVVFDMETTGLTAGKDVITEIGAVKIKNREITDRFQTFVNPERPIPPRITELTGITDDMVANAPSQEEALRDFFSFASDCVLVAHNAAFDTSFMKQG
ncbi:MAG: PHP domain-containing protein, partial [Clostridia bacterium]|nr:PHP domain-containing protein [Clostridia bacterium]